MHHAHCPVGPLACNCHLLVCPVTREALVIDPGDESAKILKLISEAESKVGGAISVVGLAHTHAHFDHFGASRAVAENLRGRGHPAQLLLHRDDQMLWSALEQQGQMFGFEFAAPLSVDRFLADEEEIEVGRLKLSVLHTPGHSPGGICLRLHENSDVGANERVFSGDSLFQGSIGRTDLWGGDSDLLIRSIRSRILTLDGDLPVHPGHGPDTRVGVEKRSNPFLS